MKTKPFLIMLLLCCQHLFCQDNVTNFAYSYLEDTIYFVSFDNRYYEVDVMKKKYIDLTSLVAIDNNGFSILNYKGKEQWPIFENGQKYYLIGGSNQVFFLENNDRIMDTYNANEKTFISEISAEAYLIEKTSRGITEYRPENLKNKFFATDMEYRYEFMPSSLPWAVSKSDFEKAILKVRFEHQVEGLIFLNGYVDLQKPQLYKKNSRIKQMEISDIHSGKIATFYLKDQIQYQEIELPFKTDEINIKIISTYPGSSYSDICLSAILPFFNAEMGKIARHTRTKFDELQSGDFLTKYEKVKES